LAIRALILNGFMPHRGVILICFTSVHYVFSVYRIPTALNSLLHLTTVLRNTGYAMARFRNVTDYRAYLARLKLIPTQLAQVTDLMREGIAQKMLPPGVSTWCLLSRCSSI